MSETEFNDRQVFREAAQFLVRLNAKNATAADHEACARWREQSALHRHAWDLAQQLQKQFEAVPVGSGGALLKGSRVSGGRRSAIKALSWLVLVAPAGWLASRMPWQSWSASYRTSTGEQRTIQLGDGTTVTLNTGSAMDVAFDSNARRILLRAGEIMVHPTTATHAMRAALRVETSEGAVEALGRQFSVRQGHGVTRVAAFQGDARVMPARGTAFTLAQGQCCTFTRDTVGSTTKLDEREAMWTQGLVYANNMRLADLITELSRYRNGVLHCADDVADLRISGVFQLNNIDATLLLLERAYPVRQRSLTPYWTVIEGRTGTTHTDDGTPSPTSDSGSRRI